MKLDVVSVAEFIGWSKAAVMTFVEIGTPLALARGATAVTVGAAVRVAPPVPKICVPPPPPQAATKAVKSSAALQRRHLE